MEIFIRGNLEILMKEIQIDKIKRRKTYQKLNSSPVIILVIMHHSSLKKRKEKEHAYIVIVNEEESDVKLPLKKVKDFFL